MFDTPNQLRLDGRVGRMAELLAKLAALGAGRERISELPLRPELLPHLYGREEEEAA